MTMKDTGPMLMNKWDHQLLCATIETYVTTKKLAEQKGLFLKLTEYPLDRQETVKAQIVHTLCMMQKFDMIGSIFER